MKGVLAIILAGGRGKMMGILRQEQAKPILPLVAKNLRRRTSYVY